MRLGQLTIHPGLWRLWIVLSLLWCFAASWVYVAGLDRKYNSYSPASFGQFSEERLSQERIAGLMRLDEYKKLAESADDDYLSEWERKWVQVTQGNLPLFYDRPSTPPGCKEILVRNYSDAVLSFTTTCKVQWSWIGFLALLVTPVALLALVLLAAMWVVNGFRRPKNES